MANTILDRGRQSSKTRAGSTIQRTRRKLRESTINTEVTACAGSGAALAGASQGIGFASTTAVNSNYNLIDWGQAQNVTPQVYNSSGTGWVYHACPWIYSPKRLRFFTDSQYVSVPFYWGLAGASRVWVDDKPALANNLLIIGASNGTIYLNLTFSSRKPRLIEIETDNWTCAVSIEPTCQIWKPQPVQGPRIVAVGASFTQGLYATGSIGAYQQLADFLGLQNVAIDGQGGSGYLANGTYYSTGTDGAGPYSNPTRRANLVAIQPDVILMGETLNDFNTPRTVADTQVAILAHLTWLRSQLPNALIIQQKSMITPYFRTAQGSSINTWNNALNAWYDGGVLSALGVKIGPDWSGIFTGTGYQGATNGSGNSDRYVYTDGAHPNDAGSYYALTQIADPLITLIEAGL